MPSPSAPIVSTNATAVAAERRQAGDEQQPRPGGAEHAAQDGRAADAVGDVAADGRSSSEPSAPPQAATVARLHLRQAVLVVQQDRQEAREPDEAAERDRVEAGHAAARPAREQARHAAPRSSGCATGGGSFASSAKHANASATGTSAIPITACQPVCSAIRGAASVAITVPELPAPAIPIARPCSRGGNQRLASGSATANDAPAKPSRTPDAEHLRERPAASQPHSSGSDTTRHRHVPTRLGPRRSPSRPSDESHDRRRQQRHRDDDALLERRRGRGPRRCRRRARPAAPST